MNIILLGAPGAGKGTQAEVICKELNIPTISTGNMLRAAVKAGTEYGLKAKAAMDAGALVSDDIVIGILKDRIAEPDAQNGFILDGFPRTVPQAEALDTMGVRIDKVVEIFVPDEMIKRRVTGRRVCLDCGATYHIDYKPSKVEDVCDVCGKPIVIRKDDQPETVISRLETYHKTTAPLKDYYEKQGKLVSIDGTKDVATTSALVLEALKA
ncbi:MAG: adenylate kinase [Ruminococcus sp.]|nr:adenylate kinase [Ruminococcus sp.]MBQ7071526.1 adenylate kinase [Ruminococcus sp.]